MIETTPLNTKEFFEKSYDEITISDNRSQLLQKIADAIIAIYKSESTVNLNFICTHNSRRSQLGQVWSYFASEYFSLNISSFSGGTEVTAFHRNTVKTLQDVGFIFKVSDFSHQNPAYDIHFEGAKKIIKGFSKTHNDPVNKSPFIAITTCNSADANCPFIPEALKRFHLPYVDPKFSDGTDKQYEAYLATNKEVAAEMFYLFSTIKKAL
jgi:arsenate reductase